MFDPIDPATPGRMAEICRRLPGRIVAMRVHEMGERDAPYQSSGPIKNRDLASDGMKRCWRAAADLGIAIQVHMKPFFAPPLEKLIAEFRDLPVVIDHLARSGMGTEADWRDVLRLAEYPKVHMKFSGINYTSKQDPPYADAKPRVKQAYEAFGAERMIWGGLGYSAEGFEVRSRTLDFLFDYASEADRAQVRGLTAKKVVRVLIRACRAADPQGRGPIRCDRLGIRSPHADLPARPARRTRRFRPSFAASRPGSPCRSRSLCSSACTPPSPWPCRASRR